MRVLDLRRLSLEMPLFSRKKDKPKKSEALNVNGNAVSKPKWEDSWLRTRVDPEEVVELLHGCTAEIKSRGMALGELPATINADDRSARCAVPPVAFPTIVRP